MLDQTDSNVSLISAIQLLAVQQQIKDYLNTEVYSNLYCNFITNYSAINECTPLNLTVIY